jgi:ABC-2 type transport system permease protein
LAGAFEIFRKELADHLTSKRSYILFAIVYLTGSSLAYEALRAIRGELQRTGGENVFLRLFTIQAGVIPSFLGFLAFFGPLIGLILSFDSINREVSSGTLGNVLSQPVHRDSVINGKFVAGAATVFLILTGVFIVMTGTGIITLGTLPTIEEWLRMLAFLFVSSVYLSLWVALGLLFSILFRREGTSALASIATWLFFTLFIYMITNVTAAFGISPLSVSLLSPSFIYTQAASFIMIPELRILGPVTYEKIIGMLPNPLPVGQSLLLVWPHLVGLTTAMVLIFAISYITFVKEEIRST